MRERGRKVGAAGYTRFQNTLWNKIGSDCTSYYIDRLRHSVFLSKTQPYLNVEIRTAEFKPYKLTLLKYMVLLYWWVVYAILLLC